MTEMSATPRHVETLIVGAGPAGLQLAYFLERAGRDYRVLEAGYAPGMFFRKFPRRRTLISINKVFTGYSDPEVNLRWDWNSLLSDDPDLLFKNYSREYFPHADELTRYLADFAARWGLRVSYRAPVTQVAREREGFLVTYGDGAKISCDRLVMATGVSQPYLPAIPGIEQAELYTTANLDPESFANQKVLIIGKGNSGFETADMLISTTALIHVLSPNPITMAWKTHFVGHLRALNNNFLDTYQLKSQNAVLDGTIEKIERRSDGKLAVSVHYSHAEQETETLIYDRVILCTGFRFDDSIFSSECRPALTLLDRFPALNSQWESTNVSNLFFAGTLMQPRDYKKSTSGFIHGFRYNIRALHRLFERRFHGRQWPSCALAGDAHSLARAMLQRINQTSALWQLFGFMGELYLRETDGSSLSYLPEVPVAYAHDCLLETESDAYLLTLEFGPCPIDPFNIHRKPTPEEAAASTFLHPVVRHFVGRELRGELHLLENLLGEWHSEELHQRPLLQFLTEQMELPAPSPMLAVAG